MNRACNFVFASVPMQPLLFGAFRKSKNLGRIEPLINKFTLVKVLISSLLFSGFYSQATKAQSPDKVLLTINNYKYTVGDFERIYNKNYNINTSEKQSVQENFNLFLKFRLKVVAALDAKLDTLKSFRDEYSTYRSQLAKSYLTDNNMLDSLLHEAYYRTQNECGVSHIMVRFSGNFLPADTLAAYNKILNIRKRITSGESFEKVAAETSEDPSSATSGGYLGYSNAFRFPYSFEQAMFKAKPGEVTMPVRTMYGYHILLSKGIRPSKGEVKVAHIMVIVRKSASDSLVKAAKNKIDSVYTLVKNGGDFAKLASTFSSDKSSPTGELPWFGTGRMIPDFEEAAFAIQNKGNVTQPVRTTAGWHIIKLIDKRPVPAFNEAKNDLKEKLISSDRNQLIANSFISKLKRSVKNEVFTQNLVPFYALDSMVYQGKINIAKADLAKVLFSIDKTKYNGADFVSYLSANRIESQSVDIKSYIDKSFNTFFDNTLIGFENSKLEQKFPEFKSLTEEFHDGILLYNIMETNVWGKAVKDTSGLKTYFTEVWSKGKPENSKLDDVKGLVTSDYQSYLEDRWIEDLKKKYKIVVNQELLAKIAKKYQSNQ